MQIQRIQTLWLLLAAVCGGLSFAFDWLKIGDVAVSPLNDLMLAIIVVHATVYPIIGICLYKNLRLQKMVARFASLFSLFAVGYVVALSYLGPNPEAEIRVAGPIMMAWDCLACIMAARAIARDEKLLRDADRIR